MKDKRNCNNMYPVYPNMPYMNQMPMPIQYYEPNMNNMDINSLERQINNLENRVSSLERKIMNQQGKSTYSESNYYMV